MPASFRQGCLSGILFLVIERDTGLPALQLAALAIASGLLQVLTFPKFNLFPLSVVALAPLVLLTEREPKAAGRFLWGTLAGCVFFAGTCYWVYVVLREYGGLGVLAAGGVFALLFLCLSLYWGLFSWLAGYCWRLPWGPLALPFLWVALEYARAHLLTGFPWLLTGYALTDSFRLARISRWTGVYGLSFLVVSVNAALVWVVFRRSRAALAFLASVLAATLLVALTAPSESYSEDHKAFLVQTNIPQEIAWEAWDPATQAPLLERLENLTVQAVGRQETPALVLWPETPASFYFFDDSFTGPYAEALARKTNSYFLMGIVAFEPGSERTKPLNSEVLLDPAGLLVSQYDKIHLVPFGEYVPLEQWLGFAGTLTAESGDFVPGNRLIVSRLLDGRGSGLICYEAIFPNLVRQFVAGGAELLVNISNDGWFHSSAARYQHLLMARMRAIENARYFLRATNTGVTAVIRPDGRIAAQLPPDRPAVLEARWGFVERQTFYSRYGDWFAQLACLIAAAALLAAGRAGSPQTKSEPRA